MKKSNIKTYRLIIKGKVQNVSYREWFSNLAILLKLNGYVKNEKNKETVKAVVQGKIQNILSIVNKSINGPREALVESIITNEISNDKIYLSFEVKY